MPTTKNENLQEKENIQNKTTCNNCDCCINRCTEEAKEEYFDDSTDIEEEYFSKGALYYLSLVVMVYVLIAVGCYIMDYALNSDTGLEKFLNK